MSATLYLFTIFISLMGYILPSFAQEAAAAVGQDAAAEAFVCLNLH